ncbi:MAG: ChaN family lipoprotein, partial [Dehalococcoidia bacterium]|nr:ChaN family lipoprotein [Dehalococcoidia bacterium]
NHIRVVGINIPFHIPRKISIGGIENLLEDDKKHLPEKIDTSISAHRAYLEEIFKDHYPHAQDPEAFENFYAAQCVWEDTMAEAIARNLTKGQMLVIAGNGHIRYKYGIPQRAFERTTAAFRTIFPAPAGMEAQLSYADYIWVTAGDKKKAPRAQHP